MNNFNHPNDIGLEPPNISYVTNVPVFPQVVPIMQQRPTKSCPLIGFGVILLLFSLASVGLSAWALHFEDKTSFGYAGLACGGFFMLTSIFAMAGGCDVGQRSCAIIACMVFGLLGLIAAAVGIIINGIAISQYEDNCSLCKFDIHLNLKADGLNPDASMGCSVICFEAYLPVHIGLCVLSLLEALFGLILSCSACCNVCSCCCCYKEPYKGGIILSPPPVTSFVTQFANPAAAPYRRLNEDNAIYA